MKKGFTLIELLGVVAVIAILMLIITPMVLRQLNISKDKISDTTLELIYTAAELYITENGDIEAKNGNVYCIALQDLVDNENLKAPIIDRGRELSLTKYIKSSYEKKWSYILVDECIESIS